MHEPIELLHDCLVLNMHVVCVLFAAMQSGADVKYRMLKRVQSGLSAFYRHRCGLSWSTGLRRAGLGVVWFLMNRCVFACATLNLAESSKIASFEVAIAVFEFPKG